MMRLYRVSNDGREAYVPAADQVEALSTFTAVHGLKLDAQVWIDELSPYAHPPEAQP